MLDFVRRHSRSWIIKVLLMALIIVFIGWGGYLYQTRHASDVAMVGNHYISQGEWRTEYENMVEAVRKQFGGNVPQKLMDALDIKKQALDALIRHYLILRGAKELGLTATTSEVRRTILKMAAFQSDGKFNLRRYKAVLWQNRLTPETFEKQMAGEITTWKVEAFIMGRAIVTQNEILDAYHFNHDKIKVAYALFDPGSFEDKVTVKDSALRSFYKKNQNQYMEPEKREIAYVVLNRKDLEKNIHPSKGEIKQYYGDNAADFTREKQVRAQRILLRIKPNASQAEVKKVRAEAVKILGEAKKGKDFAVLAKKYSQDEATAKKGGELGFFFYKQKSPAFSKAAFALKPGEISGLVRTPSGFNIIKVEEVKAAGTAPLDEVKGEIVKDLKSQGARDLVYKRAQKLRDLAYARRNIAKAALEMKMKVSDPVWITMSGNQSDPGLFTGPIRSKLFQLGEGDVSDMLEIPDGYMVAQVKSIQRPKPIPLEKIKDKVTSDFRFARAKELAQKQASEILAQAKAKKSLAAAVKAHNIDLGQSGFFSRQDPDIDLTLLRGPSLDSIFSLQDSKLFPERPLELGGRFLVCQFEGKKPAGEPSKEEKAKISLGILRQKQTAVWKTWLGQVAKTTEVKILRKI